MNLMIVEIESLGTKSFKESHEFIPNYNHYLVIHGTLFGTDGVALEAQKIAQGLAANGREIYWCSADFPSDRLDVKGRRISSLSYKDASVEELNDRIFAPRLASEKIDEKQGQLIAEIELRADQIEHEIEDYINDNAIGIVHVRNLFSLPINMPATVALSRIMSRRQEILFVLHHHDFLWEGREGRFKSCYPKINAIINNLYPPPVTGNNRIDIVINSIAQYQLLQRKGIKAELLPDSFPFDNPSPLSRYTSEAIKRIRRDLGLGEDDIILGVMARVIPRKAIEHTVQIAAALQELLAVYQQRIDFRQDDRAISIFNGRITDKSRIVLLLVHSQDADLKYLHALYEYAESLGVTTVFCGERVGLSSGVTSNGQQTYPFYEIPSIFNISLFASVQEAFNNNLLEAIWAGFVPVVFENPVFVTDIKDKLRHYISMGSQSSLQQPDKHSVRLRQLPAGVPEHVAREIFDFLLNPALLRRYAAENLEQMRLSYDTKLVTAAFDELLIKRIAQLGCK